MGIEQPLGRREPSDATDQGLDMGAGFSPEPDPAPRVRLEIREKIATRSLPCEPCKAVWGGAGSGAPCAACDRPILPAEIEFECEQPGDLLRFHQACYVLWEEECQRLERPPSEILH
jgi:hypothetical protein